MRICEVDGCGEKHRASGFCDTHYRRFKRNGTPHLTTIKERFWSKVKKNSGCWEWRGGRLRGYGSFTVKRKPVRAHRFSYELHIGPIPEGMCVLHHCDNPPCVNPAHLFVGTNADNVADMVAKGRQAGPKGERNPNSKLNANDVLAIRSAAGFYQRELAKKYGVSRSLINMILHRKRWAHIAEEVCDA